MMTIQLSRRFVLSSLIAAPAVISIDKLMPIKKWIEYPNGTVYLDGITNCLYVWQDTAYAPILIDTKPAVFTFIGTRNFLPGKHWVALSELRAS